VSRHGWVRVKGKRDPVRLCVLEQLADQSDGQGWATFWPPN
jgi:hypothetical protein